MRGHDEWAEEVVVSTMDASVSWIGQNPGKRKNIGGHAEFGACGRRWRWPISVLWLPSPVRFSVCGTMSPVPSWPAFGDAGWHLIKSTLEKIAGLPKATDSPGSASGTRIQWIPGWEMLVIPKSVV